MLKRVASGIALGTVLAHGQHTMQSTSLAEAERQHTGSGTSIEPPSTPAAMLMGGRNGWTFMLHGAGFIANTQQQAANERGRDAWFAPNWIMPMAQHPVGSGTLTLRTMLSLEPATITRKEYPLLFQQGETALGAPIVDGQHPHDFVMEFSAAYDLPLGRDVQLSFYAAPVGDPAVGPVAFPHRASASEDPVAVLGHHQQDSTHIAFSVLTGGVTWRWLRAELSGFHGAEPDERRWSFAPSPNGYAIDSAAGRLTFVPNRGWAMQYSAAHIHSIEALYPGEDQQRQTASVSYHHGFVASAMAMHDMPGMNMTSTVRYDLNATAVWGRTKSLADATKENSYLLEVLLRVHEHNAVWTRMENAGRSNELLLTPGQPLPKGFAETPIGHVAAFSFGYDREWNAGPHLAAALGAQVTVYKTPSALVSMYGSAPTGEVMFVRLRLK